jgi:hypothetical protein
LVVKLYATAAGLDRFITNFFIVFVKVS